MQNGHDIGEDRVSLDYSESNKDEIKIPGNVAFNNNNKCFSQYSTYATDVKGSINTVNLGEEKIKKSSEMSKINPKTPIRIKVKKRSEEEKSNDNY